MPPVATATQHWINLLTESDFTKCCDYSSNNIDGGPFIWLNNYTKIELIIKYSTVEQIICNKMMVALFFMSFLFHFI